MMVMFKTIGPEVITLSHYDLAEQTDIRDPEAWKAFLMEPEVKRWVESEMAIMQDTELKRLVKGSSKSRSMGQSQMINTLSKLNEKSDTKEGPVMIYMFVPMSAEQEHAPNTHKLPTNIFQRDEKDETS